MDMVDILRVHNLRVGMFGSYDKSQGGLKSSMAASQNAWSEYDTVGSQITEHFPVPGISKFLPVSFRTLLFSLETHFDIH